MKKLFTHSGIAALMLGILFTSCKKDHDCVTDPPPPPSQGCTHHARGTVEQCFGTNLWIINIYDMGNSPVNPSFAVVAPQNLPASFQTGVTNVEFDYEDLNDSVPYTCGCFPPPNPNYARKINVCNIREDTVQFVVLKPVIYLYPEKTQKVDVELLYDGDLTVTYPEYNTSKKGWSVNAKPNGTITNTDDGQEYQYLFWEGTPTTPYKFNMNEGYCVKGSDTRRFLQTTLPKLGLTPKEYNDMIVFWLPKMQENTYNIIHFAGSSYTDKAPLTIKPKPDTIIRVFMAFRASKEFVHTEEPVLPVFSRKGFTVIEWGGVEMLTFPENHYKFSVSL